MANELPEYFDNIVLGQYAMTGVPLKVYANDRYYIIPSPEDVDDPLIGYGMTPSGKMEPFDYRDIEHIMVSGNKVDLATYTKAMGDELKGVKKASDAKGGEEKKEEGGEEEKPAAEEEGEAPKSPFESFDPFAKKWSLKALYEISKDEYNAQEDALKAEMEAGKAKIDAAKEKLGNLKKQPIDDGVNSTPIVESVISDILIIASESTTYEKFISELISQKLLKREDLKDSDLVDELKTMYRGQALGKRESVNESHISEPYIFQVGDMVRNINPQCKHYGSTGIVNAIQALDGDMGNIVKYIVTNFGDTFKPGMALMKTPDQLELMDENLYTGAEHRKAVKGINEYGATPSKKNWLGWFVLNANLHGDLTAWKKGELIKAYKSNEKGYVFIYTGDYNYEAYDDIAQSDFNRIATSLDPTKHKKSYNYVKKLEKLNRLKDYEVIN